MAIEFEVEDGSGKIDATSYVSEIEATQYHENHGNSDWAALTSDAKQTALNRATAYLDSYFEWVTGRRADDDQALDWPRLGAYDDEEYSIEDDEIPKSVREATCVLALRASASDIVVDSEKSIKSFSAGPVAVEYEEGQVDRTTYTQVIMLLRGLVSASMAHTVRLDLL